MADIGAELRTLMLSDSDISTAVGTRIYSDYFPKTIEPTKAIVYNLASEDTWYSLGGPVGVERSRFEIMCYAQTRGDSIEIWQHVNDLLLDYSGTPSAVYIKQVTPVAGHEYDIYEDKKAGIFRFVTVQDFFVYYAT